MIFQLHADTRSPLSGSSNHLFESSMNRHTAFSSRIYAGMRDLYSTEADNV